MSDETLEPVAPSPEGQPTLEAVDPAVLTAESTPAQETVETPPVQPKMFAGKFLSPEDLEKAYLHSQSEASRMAAELAGFKKGVESATARPAQPVVDTPKYTVDQLESFKVAALSNMASAQASGDIDKAREYAGNIVWCDREIRKQEYAAQSQQSTRQSAEAAISGNAQKVVDTYRDQITVGSPTFNQALHDKASFYFQHYTQMGHADNAITAAHALSMAVHELGAFPTTKSASATRQDTVRNINQALKTGVSVGAGKASAGKPGLTPSDIMNMKEDEWESFKRSKGWN